MAATASTMLELGTTAPEFTLPDVVSGKPVSLASFEGTQALLVMFICHHCPFVKHIKSELAEIGRDYAPKGVGIVATEAASENPTAVELASVRDGNPPLARTIRTEYSALQSEATVEAAEVADKSRN